MPSAFRADICSPWRTTPIKVPQSGASAQNDDVVSAGRFLCATGCIKKPKHVEMNARNSTPMQSKVVVGIVNEEKSAVATSETIAIVNICTAPSTVGLDSLLNLSVEMIARE